MHSTKRIATDHDLPATLRAASKLGKPGIEKIKEIARRRVRRYLLARALRQSSGHGYR